MKALKDVKSVYVAPVCCCILAISFPLAAQEIQNGDMEGGFTDGVANGWTGWKSFGYPEGGFAAGTDHYQSPSHSQKMLLKVPAYPPKEMAIYQVVNTAVGGTYTFTLKLRTSMQQQESYPGEYMNVFMGLDPTGGSNVHSADIVWHELSNDRNTWLNESRQTTAQSVWTTIFIKANHKFGLGGDGTIWIDDVSVSGPTPDPTWTFTPTVTPTVTPPVPVGPELVSNGNFEAGFTNGLADGWSNWSAAGNGYWRQSTRVGPAGGGSYCGLTTGWYEETVALNPKTIQLGCGYGASDLFANEPNMEDTIIVGGQGLGSRLGEVYQDGWQELAEWLADKYLTESQYHPRVDAWTGMNEPDWQNAANWQRVIDFELYFTEQMHQRGLKSVVLNLSTGSPGDIDRILWCRDLFEIADYLGYHSYGGPTDQLMITPWLEGWNQDDPHSFALRARQFHAMYQERGWRFPPVIYTEGTTYFGYKAIPWIDAEDMRIDISSFIPFMDEDRWCIGLQIFVVGGTGWGDWDIVGAGITDDIGQVNLDYPVDRTDGLYSQQFGVGTLHCINNMCSHEGDFTGGVVQQVTGLSVGDTYRLGFDFKWEHANGTAGLVFQYGLDWTGQTTNGNAGSINWSGDLIAAHDLPHDIFQHHYDVLTAQGGTVSLWFRSSQNLADVSYRINLDAVSLRQVSGIVPTTPTATPTAAPAGNLLVNPGAETGDFTGWTRGGTPGGQPLIDPSTHLPNPSNHSGDHRFGISVGWASANCYQYQQIPVQSGHTYSVSLWTTHMDGTDEHLRVSWIDGGWPGTENVLYDIGPGGAGETWTESTGQSFQPTGTTATIVLRYLHDYATGIASIHVDDVAVIDQSAPPPPTDTPVPTPTPTLTPVPTSTSTPEPQGLENGDMEGGFTSGVANAWTSYVTNGSPTFSDGTDQEHGGTHSQKIVYPNPSGEGFSGIYQVVSCSSGQNGTLTAWKYDQISGSDPWAMICRLGYDLSAGTDPRAGSVVWAEFDATPHQTWLSKAVQFTTTGSGVTVFVEMWHKGWNGTHTAWFDDVTLDGVGGPPPSPTATPTVTATSPPTDTPTVTPTFVCNRASEALDSLTNLNFETSWPYSPVPQDPPGWFVLEWGPNTGPQHYTGVELGIGAPSNHRCKYEMGGTTGYEHVLGKEISWSSAQAIDFSAWCAGRKWDGSSNGTMSIGIDLDGCAESWADADVVVNRTSNDQSWSVLSLGDMSKPSGASTFTIMLRANRSGTSWNCQFDNVTVEDSNPQAGIPADGINRIGWRTHQESRDLDG